MNRAHPDVPMRRRLAGFEAAQSGLHCDDIRRGPQRDDVWRGSQRDKERLPLGTCALVIGGLSGGLWMFGWLALRMLV